MLHSAAPLRQPVPARAELRLCQLADLSKDDHRQWDKLSEAARESSIFAKACFLRPSLTHCDRSNDAILAIVVDCTGEWLGVMPLRKSWRYGRVPFPLWQAWQHPNMFSAAQLVRPGAEHLFWESLFAGLEEHAPARPALQLVDLPADQAVSKALIAVCETQDRPIKFDRIRARAVLGSESFAADRRLQIKPDARRRYASLERKLEAEAGPVGFTAHREPAEIILLAEQFIALELAGWKGRAGSALACDEGNLAFFRAMIAAAAGLGLIEVATLRVRGRVLAMSIHFVDADGWGHGFKSVFNEEFAAFAPGVLLLIRLSDHLGQNGFLPFDSCSAPDQLPVGSLWPERREFFDCGIALGGASGRQAFRLLAFAEQLAHARKGRNAVKA